MAKRDVVVLLLVLVVASCCSWLENDSDGEEKDEGGTNALADGTIEDEDANNRAARAAEFLIDAIMFASVTSTLVGIDLEPEQ